MHIPYEKQESPRMCGAAALCMAYRSLGLTLAQAEVWPRISAKNGEGELCAHTHLLAADALNRGLSALVIEAREPWAMLQRCLKHKVRAILNHRSTLQAWTGHYSLLMSADEQRVALHDPQFGPARMVRRDEFLQMWLPMPHPLGEITGNALVVLARQTEPAEPCTECGEPLPADMVCSQCLRTVELQPANVLGCAAAECSGRTWQRVFCPHCDKPLLGNRVQEPLEAGVGGSAPPALAPSPGMGLNEAVARQQGLFAALEQSLPDGEQREAVRQMSAKLTEQHGQLMAGLKDELAGAKDTMQQMQGQIASLKVKEAALKEAKKKPPAAPAAPPPPEIEAGLGPKVRAKLLQEFTQSHGPSRSKRVADLWDWLRE